MIMTDNDFNRTVIRQTLVKNTSSRPIALFLHFDLNLALPRLPRLLNCKTPTDSFH